MNISDLRKKLLWKFMKLIYQQSSLLAFYAIQRLTRQVKSEMGISIDDQTGTGLSLCP
jgi:hypothetical protein